MPVKKIIQRHAKAGVASEAEVAVLTSILEKVTTFSQHLDTQADVIIGLSLATFVFALTLFHGANLPLYGIVLACTSAASALLGLLAIHPPNFMYPSNDLESLMFIKEIARKYDPSQYAVQLDAMLASREKTIRQFAREIYNISTYYYQPKSALFKLSKRTFFIGILASLIIFVAFLALGIDAFLF